MNHFPSNFRYQFGLLLITLSMHATADDSEFFETRIRPVLVKHCYECHSAGSAKLKGELRVDFRDGLRNGGESGPAVVAGKPDKSLILSALRHESFEMPPKEMLPKRIIADFETWVRNGAFDPRDKEPSALDAAGDAWKVQLAQRRKWWSLQDPKVVTPPRVDDELWSQEPVDRFIRSALDRAKLSPAIPAEAKVLLRRLSFVLTGLPPKSDQVAAFPAAFQKDPNKALAALVDELLDSPHFGERFARHWMDVVRYTDTYGYEWDNPAKGSWEYRDYLIRAFNDDVGFDQLIREQIAGDLLPQPRINQDAQVNESLIGPMFYHMGEHRHGNSFNFNGIHQEMINNKIDAFSKAFLATTVACARCHDHKLDAVSQTDYYALAGVFMTPRWTSRVIDAPGKHDRQISQLKSLRAKIRKALGDHWQSTDLDLASKLRAWATAGRQGVLKVPIDDPAYPMKQILSSTNDTIADAWEKTIAEWRTTRDNRIKGNAKKFTVLADFKNPSFPAGWVIEGDGIKHGYAHGGEPLVSLAGDTIIDRVLPRGFHTGALSSKLPGAVRPPALQAIDGKFVSAKVLGREWGGYITMPQNAFQAEGVKFLQSNHHSERWISIGDSTHRNGVTRIWVDFATSSLIPNFPPRTGLARAGTVKLPDSDMGYDKRSTLSITSIVAHDAGGTPADTLEFYSALFGSDANAPKTIDEAWTQVGDWATSAVSRWATDKATEGDIQFINWLLLIKQLPNDPATSPKIAALIKQYRDVESQIAFPRSANSMDERNVEPVNYRLNIRGDVYDEGDAIDRDFLGVFAERNDVDKSKGSGRLKLAKYLSSERNPQTARVYVNRVWYWLFGRGIVATPSDFGKLGERPSHPELLDWLALKFVEEGWSTKKLVRRLVLSQTFRQSGAVAVAAAESDPNNCLLHHYPTRRLEAEAIRDSLLAVSGRLDAKLFGRPIDPPRPAEDPAKRLFSGPLDSNGRRSIYMKMSIMEPPKFLVAFNLPDLKLPTGRRDVTNDPAQALVLLNHPLVVKMADHWAERLAKDGSATIEERIRAMFVSAFGRPPGHRELNRWKDAVVSFSKTDDILGDQSAWAEIAHAMFNAKEFIYYR